ncbi:MAG TPA: hypothetical protein VJ352_16075 [Geodermatophilus sp.]|nr:hypothetical protein [Geodermatophilus sp.]
MRYVTVQEIIGPDPEPMYVVQVKVPMRAGEAVVDELTAVVGQAVYDFEQTVPDRTWHSGVTGYFPPGYGRDDTEE